MKNGITNQQLYSDCQVTKNNSEELRKRSWDDVRSNTTTGKSDQIKKRLIEAWASWVPDYEGWLKWSGSLYTPDALIYAIGDEPQRFADYQASMKYQRDCASMEMGPIMQIAVEDNTAALVYHMYLTPKNVASAETIDIVVTEFNTFEEINGMLMVTRLDLYTSNAKK